MAWGAVIRGAFLLYYCSCPSIINCKVRWILEEASSSATGSPTGSARQRESVNDPEASLLRSPRFVSP